MDETVRPPYLYGCCRNAVIAARNLNLFEVIGFLEEYPHFVVDAGLQVSRADHLFLIGNVKKTTIHLLELLFVQLVT